jgi:hypothetical protein
MKGYKVQWRKNFTLDKIARTKHLYVIEVWELKDRDYMNIYGFGGSKGSFRKRKKQFKNYCRKQQCDVVFLKYMGDEAYEVANTGKHQYTKVQ